MNKIQKKSNNKRKYRSWIAYFEELYKKERQKVAGYEQLAKVHSAYISILLKKLGATDSENAIRLTQAEVKEALENYEARATIDNNAKTYKLYCEAVE